MSDFPQHRAMHSSGPFATAIHTGPHSYGSHPVHQQAVTNHHMPCPYEDKVTKDGTTARMVLLFLRELLEQLSVGEQVQQSYGCPMTRCQHTFAAPLQVIQHLLSCPELAGGEFDCDRCSTSHSFPTNEKDWAQWAGWRCPQSVHAGHNIQRKRSLGSKMKDFALRKKDPSRKQNPGCDPPLKSMPAMGTRPSTAASDAPSTLFTSRPFQHHVAFPGQAEPGAGAGFVDFQKPMLPSGIPGADGTMFWPGWDGASSDLQSTVPSITRSSTVDSQSERLSQNTSQSTLFSPGLSQYQVPATSGQDHGGLTSPPQYPFPAQMPYEGGMASLPGRTPSASAMCLDEPVPLAQSPISPTDMSTTSSGPTWWGPKVEVETSRPPPPSSGPDACFPLQTGMLGNLAGVVHGGMSSPTSPSTAASPYYSVQPTSTHCMSRALSQESMQSNITTVFGTPATDATPAGGLGPLSPRAGCNQRPGAGPSKHASESTVEELVCDECQWKPRGVRENLKGYLRKHKNTHKGVRLACDVPNCVKTFSRLDNLKKHKKDKHGIEDTSSSACAKRAAGVVEKTEEEAGSKRPTTVESELRSATEDYSMLWPALHF